MLKTLRFSEPLPELILQGTKNSTWRIHDDKNITVGDMLCLQRNDGTEFGRASVLRTRTTTFGKLIEADMDGHEKFSTTEEMYQTYAKYYNMFVGPETVVKVIKFRLEESNSK